MSLTDKDLIESYTCCMIQRTDSKQYYSVDEDIFTHWYRATEWPNWDAAESFMALMPDIGLVQHRVPLQVKNVRIEFHDGG